MVRRYTKATPAVLSQPTMPRSTYDAIRKKYEEMTQPIRAPKTMPPRPRLQQRAKPRSFLI